MKDFFILVCLAIALISGAFLGAGIQRDYTEWKNHVPERMVAALPGVGQGWIDTLRLVAGPATVDTLTEQAIRGYGQGLLGLMDPDHDPMTISIRLSMLAYGRDVRLAITPSFFLEYRHPATVLMPSAIVAHEFGHRFEVSLWPHSPVREGGDTLPQWARDDRERLADRFARAMLAIRGWDDPDSTDKMMNHVVHIRLMQALTKVDE